MTPDRHGLCPHGYRDCPRPECQRPEPDPLEPWEEPPEHFVPCGEVKP